MNIMILILLLLLVYITIINSISNDVTIEKCLEYGFNSTDLECKVILYCSLIYFYNYHYYT